jgi:acetoacetate decarboxylase
MGARIRYGARAAGELRNRELEATRSEIWSTAVTVIFETDPDVVAAVLPPPLEPSDPTARLRIAVVDMGSGLRPFGAGWFGVRARHGEVEGEYPLFMPMTTEQATVGGRETFGEPKKIGAVTIEREGDRVTATIERMGFRVAEASGTLGAELPDFELDKVDFYFKLSPSPEGVGLDGDPLLVHCHRHERARRVRAVDGDLKLMDSPLDPVADVPVRRILSFQFAELASTQRAEIVGRVPAAWLEPFVHQRYDDLSVLASGVK